MSVLFRVGDLVAYADGYRNGQSYCHWCRIISMEVGNRMCGQVEVVRGHGVVLNTKVRYGVEVLGWSVGLIWDLGSEIIVSGGDIGKKLYTTETNSVHLVEWSFFLKKYDKMMRKMDFVRLNRNPIDLRDEKLNELGV